MIITKRKSEFTIGKQSRLLKKSCHKCKKKFKVGDTVLGNSGSHNGGNRHHYHKRCWDKLFQ